MNIKKIWRNKALILEGIQNNLFKKEYVEVIAAERQSICDNCELLDLKGDACLVPGSKPCCGECGCSLDFKTRSLASECPHPKGPKWSAYLTEEEEDTLNTELGI
jgi:hypothetical protein